MASLTEFGQRICKSIVKSNQWKNLLSLPSLSPSTLPREISNLPSFECKPCHAIFSNINSFIRLHFLTFPPHNPSISKLPPHHGCRWLHRIIRHKSDRSALFASSTQTLFNQLSDYFCVSTSSQLSNLTSLWKIAIYCPRGSGTLRQQLLMMHWLCTNLHYLALSCTILHYLALSCT